MIVSFFYILHYFFIINFSYNSLSEKIRHKVNKKYFPNGQVKTDPLSIGYQQTFPHFQHSVSTMNV